MTAFAHNSTIVYVVRILFPTNRQTYVNRKIGDLTSEWLRMKSYDALGIL